MRNKTTVAQILMMRIRGELVLGWLNMLLFQWFCVRLWYSYNTADNSKTLDQLGVLFPILPLTGWSSAFKPNWYRTISVWKNKGGAQMEIG
jgi:hypothetical protein